MEEKYKNINKRKTTVLIPYYEENGEVFVYIQKRSEDAKRLPGYFGFFGGGIEESETPEEGVKREAKEELGIELDSFEKFAQYEFFGSITTAFFFEVNKDFENEINIMEGDFGKFITEEEMIKEPKMLFQDKTILGNFFGYKKRGNPYI